MLFAIGLLILGPERLPRVASQIGRWVSKARRTAAQLRRQLEREMALNEIRQQTQRKPPKPAPSARSGAADGEPGDTDAASAEASGDDTTTAVSPAGDGAAITGTASAGADSASNGATANQAAPGSPPPGPSADGAGNPGGTEASAAAADETPRQPAADT